MSILQRIKQLEIEDKFSRKNVREKVLLDVNYSTKGSMLEPYKKACAALFNWMSTKEYTSTGKSWVTKNARKEHLSNLHNEKELTINDIVTELLIIILPVQGAQSIQGIAGRLGNLMNFDDVFDGVRTAAEIIGVLEHCGLYRVIAAQDSDTGTVLVESLWSLEEETLQYIANTKYLPPMIIPPNEVTSNFNKTRVSIKKSIILKGENHHNKPLCLDNLNLVNAIAYELDENMLQYKEESSKPLDTYEKQVNFQRMSKASREVYEDILDNDNIFYIPWNYDKRGREYSEGYHVHIQASEYKKSLVNFHKKELITK